jgi:hypothetical protein
MSSEMLISLYAVSSGVCLVATSVDVCTLGYTSSIQLSLARLHPNVISLQLCTAKVVGV